MEPKEERLPRAQRRSKSVGTKSWAGLAAAPEKLLELPTGLDQRIKTMAKELGHAAQVAAAAKLEEFLKDLGPLLSGGRFSGPEPAPTLPSLDRPDSALCDRLADVNVVHRARHDSSATASNDSIILDLPSEPDKHFQQYMAVKRARRRVSVCGTESGHSFVKPPPLVGFGTESAGSSVALRGLSKGADCRSLVNSWGDSRRPSIVSPTLSKTISSCRTNSPVVPGLERCPSTTRKSLRSRVSSPVSHASGSEAVSDRTQYQFKLTTSQVDDMLNSICVSSLSPSAPSDPSDSRSSSNPTPLGSDPSRMFHEKPSSPPRRRWHSVLPMRARALLESASPSSKDLRSRLSITSSWSLRPAPSSRTVAQLQQENDIPIAQVAVPSAEVIEHFLAGSLADNEQAEQDNPSSSRSIRCSSSGAESRADSSSAAGGEAEEAAPASGNSPVKPASVVESPFALAPARAAEPAWASGPTLLGAPASSAKEIQDLQVRETQNAKGSPAEQEARSDCSGSSQRSTASLESSVLAKAHICPARQRSIPSLCVHSDYTGRSKYSWNLHQSQQERDRSVVSIAQAEILKQTADTTDLIKLALHHELFPFVVQWFRCWGIVPLSHPCFKRFGLAHANRFIAKGIAITVIVYRMREISHSKSSRVGSLTDFVLAVNSLACLMSSWTLHGCQVFMSDFTLLVNYAKMCHFHHRWRWQSRKQFMVSVLAWLSVVLARVLLGGVENWPGVLGGSLAMSSTATSYVGVAAFIFESGIFIAVLFFLQHFLNAFTLAIDSFACRYLIDPDGERAIHEWGMLRGILRLGSTAMWRLLMVPTVTSALMVLLYCADLLTNDMEAVDRLPWLVPTTLLTCMSGYVLWSASQVTSACERLPPIINSFLTMEEDGQDRVVRYIQNSAAGFYIGDILLTASIVLQVFNVVLALMTTVVTRSIIRK